MIVTNKNSNRPTTLGPLIGSGACGEVYGGPVPDYVYKSGQVERSKVEHLIANRVVPTRPGYSYAWPEAVALDPSTGEFRGYAMRKAEDGLDTEKLFGPVAIPEWFRVRVALNHVRSLIDLEAAGYRRGDIPNSMFHRDGSITEVDLDSLQVNHQDVVFHSGYAKPSTAAPEVLEHYKQGGEAGFETTREHDAWAVASLVWMLLMRGEHPFDAVPIGPGAETNILDRTMAGQWPHDAKCPYAEPRPGARKITELNRTLQSLFRQTFADGHPNRDPRNRPTLSAWEQALERIDTMAP